MLHIYSFKHVQANHKNEDTHQVKLYSVKSHCHNLLLTNVVNVAGYDAVFNLMFLSLGFHLLLFSLLPANFRNAIVFGTYSVAMAAWIILIFIFCLPDSVYIFHSMFTESA
jgi:hypothetical protein